MDDQNQLLILERFTMRKHYIVRRKLYENLRSVENAVSKKKKLTFKWKSARLKHVTEKSGHKTKSLHIYLQSLLCT